MVNGMLAMGEDGAIDPGVFGAVGMPGQMPGENMFAGIAEEDGQDRGQGQAGEELANDDGGIPEGDDEDTDEGDGEEDIAVSLSAQALIFFCA